MKPNTLHRLSARLLLIMLMLFASERVWSQEFTPYLKSLNAKFRIDGHVYSPIASNQLSGTPPDTGMFADWIDSSSTGRKGLLRSNGAVNPSLNAAFNYYTKLYKDPQNTTDDQFDGGNKVFNNPNNWGFKWSNSGVLAKDDINNLGVHFTRDYGDSVWAIFSSDRRTTNGTSYVDFELYQKAITQTLSGNTGTFTSLGTDCGRSKGDILITVQYTGGGRVDSIFFYTWDVFTGSGGCNGFNWKRVYPPVYTAFGYSNVVTNNQTTPVPYGAFGSNSYGTTNQFVEVAINLTNVIKNVINVTGDTCSDVYFKSLFVKTKSSASFTADLKDMIAIIPLDLNVGLTHLAPATFCSNTTDPTGLFNNGPADTRNGTLKAYTMSWSPVSTSLISFGSTAGADIPVTIGNVTQYDSFYVIYTFKPRAGCTRWDTTKIYVHPTPSVSQPSNDTKCAGETGTINFTGTGVYHWTSSPNIGFGTSGTGNIGTFTAVNTGTSAVVATITVTPKAGICTGITRTFTFTVNPSPGINPIADQAVCNGAATTAVTFSGNAAVSYIWTNDNTNIGYATASGTTSGIPSFNGVNTGTANAVANFSIRSSNGNCFSQPELFSITVYPTATVNNIGNRTHCNNDAATEIAFSSPVAGTTFAWTSTSDLGFGSSGSGNIGSYTAVNTGNTPVTATITVTPTVSGCTGTSNSFTVTVNPTPTVNSVGSQVICNNAATTAVTFSGSVAGTVYNWTNDNATIGLASSGSGNIGTFTAVNTGNSAVAANVTVAPVVNNCTGVSQTFTINVNPSAKVTTLVLRTTVTVTLPA